MPFRLTCMSFIIATSLFVKCKRLAIKPVSSGSDHVLVLLRRYGTLPDRSASEASPMLTTAMPTVGLL